MKNTRIYSKKIVVTALLIGIFTINLGFAQKADSHSKRKNPFLSGWSLNLNVGSNLFWGDIRQYDYWPVYHYENEWSLAYGAILSKKLSNIFDVRFQVLNGKLAGTKRPIQTYFKSDVTDFSGQITLNFSNLFSPDKPYKNFETYGIVGLGLSNWSTTKYTLGSDIVTGTSGFPGQGFKKRTTELFSPIGFGIDINLSPSFALNLENTWRITNSDIVDVTSGGFYYDMYTYTSVGLKFNFIGKSKLRNSKKLRYTGESKYNQIKQKNFKHEHEQNRANLDIKDGRRKQQLINESLKTRISSTMPSIITKGEELMVNILIKKPNVMGDGTIRQELPLGSKLVNYDVKGAKISMTKNILSIFWYEMPPQSEVSINYVINTAEVAVGDYDIDGIFTFYKNNQSELLSFTNHLIVEQGNGTSSYVTPSNTYSYTNDNYNQGYNNTTSNEIIKQYNNDYNSKYKDNKYTDTYTDSYNNSYTDNQTNSYTDNYNYTNNNTNSYQSANYSDVEYRIQIRAKYGSRLSITALKSRYNISGEIYEDNFKGYYIYTVGSFAYYEDAKQYRDYVRSHNIRDAFIVAFRNGKRLNSLSDL